MKKINVLVLSEDEDLLRKSKMGFASYGDEVEMFIPQTVDEAIAISEKVGIQICVIDADMPMTIEFVKMLKKKNPTLQVIAAGSCAERFYREIEEDEEVPVV
ncbi:MAG: hypothetical protein FWE07_04060 [Turicibacter sp.]|nr:hypothetical protein [Turicibacter sp.]